MYWYIERYICYLPYSCLFWNKEITIYCLYVHLTYSYYYIQSLQIILLNKSLARINKKYFIYEQMV